jgi:hypothetical protein
VGIRFAPLPFEEYKPDVYKIVDARNDRGGGYWRAAGR